MVELDCPDVVEMAGQSELALLDFIVPYLDHVVVTSRYEHWLSIVEMYASNRA